MNQSKKCYNSKLRDRLQCFYFSNFPAELKKHSNRLPATQNKKMEVLLLFIRNNDGFPNLLYEDYYQ